jgi:hypothetical protein
MKLYWNESYPDCLYTIYNRKVFCLGTLATNARALNGFADGFLWSHTDWYCEEVSQNNLNFEYIGSL